MLRETILIKMTLTENYVALTTYDRKHGHHGRFLIDAGLLSRAISKGDWQMTIDKDCTNYVEIYTDGRTAKFNLLWLNSYPGDAIHGFSQLVTIPIQSVCDLLTTHEPLRLLSLAQSKKATLDASHATRTIHRIRGDPRVSRAFSKALRDAFMWAGDHITLHDDGGYNFFFTTRSGCPHCGGLILHEGERDGFPYVYYSVHT